MYNVVATDKIPQLTAAALVSVAGLRVNPPINELRHPAFAVRVAGRPNVGLYTTGGAVTGEHIEELTLGKVSQFVKYQ